MGIEPRTWSEAIQLRIQKQEGQKGVPNGWSNRFPNGSIYDVKVIKMIKQSNFNPYPNEMLPIGFIYPEHYLKLAKSTDNINYDEEYVFPWWFENSDKNINEIINIYKEITGLPNLLPFARNGTWSACFDFLDHSGNPKVIVLIQITQKIMKFLTTLMNG